MLINTISSRLGITYLDIVDSVKAPQKKIIFSLWDFHLISDFKSLVAAFHFQLFPSAALTLLRLF